MSLLGCASVVAVACGNSNGGSQQTPGDQSDGEASDSQVSDDVSDGGGVVDAGDDGDAGTIDSNWVDADLDVPFPDEFYGPEAGDDGGDGGGNADAGPDGGCSPNGVTCNGNIADKCQNGVETITDCTKLGQTCANGYGCVVCTPGTGSCNGNTATICKSDGSGYYNQYCDPLLGESCQNGACIGDCANLGESYIGCEYFAVTMSNSQLDQTNFYASVSLSNTSTSKSANVNITGPNNFNQSATIPPGQLKEFQIPWVNQLSAPGGTPATTALVKGGAYHIRSNEPMSAYQFNARDYTINGTFSYTNDASILLPVNALTGNYRVATQATWNYSSFSFPGLVTVIGTQANTSVKYTAPAGNPITAGAGLSTTGGTVTLGVGDVIQITSGLGGNGYGSDQSGGLIAASAPVEVFGGNDCSFVPATVWCCDHMEEANFPTETLRGDYLVTLPNNQNGTPRQFVKIVGTKNGTNLTYDPNVAAPTTVNAGQVLWFETTKHFHVTANNPIFVGQHMESEQNFTPSSTAGDPSLSLAVATSQFRKDYQFVAPANYAQNWVNIIAPTGAQIAVDGTAVPANQYVPIGNSGYSVAYVTLCANNSCTGVHKASGNQAFGIEVYGYGDYTSYMFPGGLNLTR